MNKLSNRCLLLLATLFTFLFFPNANANDDFCSLSCNNQINLSLPAQGFEVITPQFILTGSNNCSGNFAVSIADGNGNIVPGNVVNCLYLGQTLMVTVTEVGSSPANSCWGNIFVEDKLSPTLTCPSDTVISCSDSTDPSNTGMPTVTDNCFGTPILTYTDNTILHNCSHLLYDVTIERTWTATDASGNTTSCTQNIFLAKALLANVVFPPNATVDCFNPNLDPTNTGEPTVSGASFGGFCKLIYTYTDLPISETCPGGYKFVREWFAIDCCSGDVLTGTQLIEVTDTTPPELTCPVDLTIGTSSDACFGSVILPDATATDDCSTVTITIEAAVGTISSISGNLTISGLPLGTHTIEYIATDGCGNADTCEMTITVEDNIAPIAICEGPTSVSLDNTGCAIVFDSTFNDGSYDNCCIDTFFVRRVGDPDFMHYVKFDCNDIGDTVMVEFLVVDKSGNENSCMAQAIVEDFLPPVIICPSDKTISCTEYPLDTLLIGAATGSDACGIDTLFFEDDESLLNLCNLTGTIKRTWTIVDNQGLTASCIQTITLVDNGGGVTLNIPPDITVGCQDPIDVGSTGEATVTNNGCSDYIAVVSDSLVLEGDPCTEKIIRTWALFNNCTNMIEDEQDQLIVKKDMDPPLITCPPDTVVRDFIATSAGLYACEEVIVPEVAMAFDSCSGLMSITNDSPFAPAGFGESFAPGIYPLGTTTVTYTAVDSCGNEASCTADFTVVDETSPEFPCGGDIVLLPDQGFPITISPDSFLLYLNLEDSCHNPVTLTFDTTLFSQTVYSCDDPSYNTVIQTVEFTISDAIGNTSICANQVVIILYTDCLFNLTFFGSTKNEDGEKIQNVDVEISNDMDTMISSSDEGYFTFGTDNIGGDYTIKPIKDDDYSNGVSTFDLVLIKKHILGNALLNSPFKIIAADANNDGIVTTFDMVQLKQLILQNWDELPDNTSWRFVDANHEFSDPANPFMDDIPESMDCVNVTENQLDVYFTATKIGDVNGNASTNGFIATDTRNEESVEFNIEDVFMEKNKTYQIPVFSNDIKQLNGFQFTLNLDTDVLEFVEIENGLLSEADFGFRFVDQGLITCSWINESEKELSESDALFFIKAKAKQSRTLKNAIHITSEKTKALAYDYSENTFGIDLFFDNEKQNEVIDNADFILYQNHPNPFSKSTNIRFYLPENTDVELQILDVSGKTIKSFSDYYLLGEHTIELDRNVFPSSGVYIYKLITPSFSESKKMTLIK